MNNILKDLLKRLLKRVSRIMYIFPVDRKKIFFLSFNGQTYGYDSRAVVEFLNLNYPDEYKLYWGIQDKEGFKNSNVQQINFISLHSVEAIYHMITAGALLYNINPPSYIEFREEQKLINTWHGYPLKKVGKYVNSSIEQFNVSTAFISHSKHYTEAVLQDSLGYKGVVLKCGAPRNDIFFLKNLYEISKEIRRSLNLEDKKVVLYAPTFRDEFEYEELGIDLERLKYALQKKMGGEWLVLCRLHPMVACNYKMQITTALDVSWYPDMQDLLLIADVLVTDYSSSMWDFALQMKPVLLYVSDINKYENDRGLYCSCEKLPYLVAKNNNEMVDLIERFDEKMYIQNLKKYFDIVESYEKGNACQTIVDYIRNVK